VHDCLIEAVTKAEDNDITIFIKHTHTKRTHRYTMNMKRIYTHIWQINYSYPLNNHSQIHCCRQRLISNKFKIEDIKAFVLSKSEPRLFFYLYQKDRKGLAMSGRVYCWAKMTIAIRRWCYLTLLTLNIYPITIVIILNKRWLNFFHFHTYLSVENFGLII